MSNEFWPDHQARCTSCGRSIPYQDAKADGWKLAHNLPPARPEPTILPALCWRCDRDARAAEMAKEPDPRD